MRENLLRRKIKYPILRKRIVVVVVVVVVAVVIAVVFTYCS